MLMQLQRRLVWRSKSNIRHLYTATRGRKDDEGDWFYSSEWWGTDSGSHSNSIFRSTSDQGNGVVSVLAYPSSRPYRDYWSAMENWLQQRSAEMHNGLSSGERFRVLGYQWRVLRFNDNTRQSTVKIMAGCTESDPHSIFCMQQAHCLAVPYLKSMVSSGLATIASSGYDLPGAVYGQRVMNILCIGHGGGSLPLFLASKIQGARIDIVEIDPLVISASIEAMGFPAFSRMASSSSLQRAISKPSTTDQLLWGGVHERLHLFESDAEKFILEKGNSSPQLLYDMVLIDAYDGEDIFPRKLWDPELPFLSALNKCLHPEHGAVVVNLHSDSDILDADGSVIEPSLPMGKYVSSVCRAYRDVLCSGSGSGFQVGVPWVCNSTLVVGRGLRGNRDMVMEGVASKAVEVENLLNLPFSCLQYIKRSFVLV